MTHPDSEVLAEFRAGLIDRAPWRPDIGAPGRLRALRRPVRPAGRDLSPARRRPGPRHARRPWPGGSKAYSPPRRLKEMMPNGPLVTAPADRAPSPRPRRRWDFRLVALRVLAPAAAVAVLAAGGYGLSRIGESSTVSEASGSAASSAATAAAVPQEGALPSAGSASRHQRIPAGRSRARHRSRDQPDQLPARHASAAAGRRDETVRQGCRGPAEARVRAGQGMRAPGNQIHPPGDREAGRDGPLPGSARHRDRRRRAATTTWPGSPRPPARPAAITSSPRRHSREHTRPRIGSHQSQSDRGG